MSKYKTVWAPVDFEDEKLSTLVFKNNPGPDWTEYNSCVEVIERRALDEAIAVIRKLRESAAWSLDHEVLSRYVDGAEQEHLLKHSIEVADEFLGAVNDQPMVEPPERDK